MKKTIAIVILAASLGAPAFAAPEAKFKLSDFKTVAVQPILGASNNRGLFEMQMAASAANLTIKPAAATAVTKAAASLQGGDQGFGFAGKAQQSDIRMLMLGDGLGILPTLMKLDPEKAKATAAGIQGIMSQFEGKIDPDVIKVINIALMGVQQGDFQTATKAVLVAMAASTMAITKGNERVHGYLAVGLYAGLASLWAAGGTQNTDYAELAPPLVMLLEEDAAMGGSDRTIATHLKAIAAELNSAAPNLDKVLAALAAMNAVKPD